MGGKKSRSRETSLCKGPVVGGTICFPRTEVVMLGVRRRVVHAAGAVEGLDNVLKRGGIGVEEPEKQRNQ